MITKIVLRNFKRFKDETFELDPQVVFAGQNNSGKTTVIQAISAWQFALRQWLDSGNKERAIGLTRKEFASVPLREFNQLWTDKSTGMKRGESKHQGTPRPLEIEIHGNHRGNTWELTMEFRYNNKDQIYAGPGVVRDDIPDGAKELKVVHIPSFSGISTEEHEVNSAYQDVLVGQGKPGDILRNLLQEVGKTQDNWRQMGKQVEEIFGYELAQPSPEGQAFIVCEYRRKLPGGRRSPLLDINTAGSGFQQVLLLLAFLYARPATVLLIDEPDAHLHFNLQSTIYRLLKDIAAKRGCQLIIATHSEVLIDAAVPEKIISFFGEHPRRLSDSHERGKLQTAMKELASMDLLKAQQSESKILFVEGQSDFDILRAWANAIGHSARRWFNDDNAYWYNMRGKNPRPAQDHFIALQAAFPEMQAFVLIDSDNVPDKTHGFDPNMRGIVLQQWTRYEIENYLVHLDAIERFVHHEALASGGGLFAPNPKKVLQEFKGIMGDRYFNDPLNDPTDYLKSTKSSESFLPKVLHAARVSIGKDEYHRIAAQMRPEEIHPEVTEKLDAIAAHFGIVE